CLPPLCLIDHFHEYHGMTWEDRCHKPWAASVSLVEQYGPMSDLFGGGESAENLRSTSLKPSFTSMVVL
ncbi:hypothetical protein ACQ1ZS_14845, partial [Enterococcus faecalis]|uniref:hypothetical protein n=1 Tax=Enterococcus faecalis TaxID=1351 RepID=UPI003D6A38EC